MSAAIAETGLLLEGLRCGGCAHQVESALRAASGVREADVNYANHRARVAYDPGRVDVDGLVREVESLGFQAIPYDPEQLERPSDRTARLALVRVLVAAFLAGNVMWLAAALYAGSYQGMDPSVREMLRWLAVALSVPAATWCAAPFWHGAWTGLRRGVLTVDVPIVLGIATSVGTAVAGTLAGSEHLFIDSAAVIVFLILLGRTLERRASARASEAVDRLRGLVPPDALRVGTNGELTRVARDALRIGDVIRIAAGETFPADASVLAHAVEVDESIVTGESTPVLRAPGAPVPAGAVAANDVDARVVAEAGRDHLSRMVALLERAQATKPRLQRLADRVASVFAPVVVALAALTAGLALLAGLPGLDVAMRTASVLIVACPCALALATPAAITAAVGRAASLGIWVKEGAALERLAAADVFLLDKTGTLTEGRVVVEEVLTREGLEPADVLRDAARAEGPAPHPIADAIRQAAGPVPALLPHEVAPGLGVRAGDAKDRVRVGRLAWLEDEGVTPEPGLRESAEKRAERGGTLTWVSRGDALQGAIVLFDEPRADAREAVARLHARGGEVELLTGDHTAAARCAAERTGIRTCHAELHPEHKVERIEAWRRKGGRVAFVGDGVNDAAALGAAEVGIAMARGADVTREAADVVLKRPELRALPDAVELARATLLRIKENLAMAVLYNTVAVPLAMTGVLEPLHAAVAMSLSSIVVVANATRLLRWEPGA